MTLGYWRLPLVILLHICSGDLKSSAPFLRPLERSTMSQRCPSRGLVGNERLSLETVCADMDTLSVDSAFASLTEDENLPETAQDILTSPMVSVCV